MLTHAAERERVYEREHRIAESLQRVLLRASPGETLPGVSVVAFHEAVMDEATVGGDSFDAFALDGDRVALVVADASGKGLAAAERVAEIRFALRAFLREHRDPSRALACLNDFVCDAQRLGRRDDSAFATLTLAVFSAGSGVTTCLCAGGEPPLVLRMDGMVEAVPVRDPALGLFPGHGYGAATVSLGAGDIVLLATDGLTEARRAGAFLGLEGLARLAVQAPPGPLSQICRSVFEGVRAFAGGAFHDDACLLMGRRK
jgi:serine phosphatase RsbU (regulator of sigma subunit)